MPEAFVVRPRAALSGGASTVAAPSAARRVATLPPAMQPLAEFLDDPDTTDVFINPDQRLFVDKGSGPCGVDGWHATEQEVRALAIDLIALGDRHIDDAHPCVDVRLEGGIRVHAVLPPVCVGGTAVSIRIPRLDRPSLADLQQSEMFSQALRGHLHRLVERRENVLITGAAGAGKTTLLGAMLSAVSTTERIITIEDVAELRLNHPHHVRLESRQANLEGAGKVAMAQLVREALRMRPDRLVVGECRGPEIRELLSALNTGHDGGAGTVHANSLDDVSARLEALGALAGLDDVSLARQVTSAIGCVIHVRRGDDGHRRVDGIGRPVLAASGRLSIKKVPWADE
ncbi:TadA family conjugal transfer-associated ATPase [Microbacterium sp. NPDC076911]|uniref:TadA family conjugal transfer-associated ATPase n=1 Tax=Microbacterium sp. NPDC076911 TaxID=3154958 RepID=UPI0034233777